MFDKIIFSRPPSIMLAVFVGIAVLAAEAAAADFEPTENYQKHDLSGWSVLVHRSFLADKPDLSRETLKMLEYQLFMITRKAPAAAVAKLRTVTIWVEEAEPHHACMAYHPDAGWLREHGMNPDKARCVELANARNFLDWINHQPWMVFHELAHAHHHQFLKDGFENELVRSAFEQAMTEKRYDSVLRSGGRREKAYATTNPMEYFAETAEAFFGVNDFYPFVKSELAEHDPAAHQLHQQMWGEKKSEAKEKAPEQ